jgi:hypothetical protein
MGPIIQIREHGKILTVLLNVPQGRTTAVIHARLLRKERSGIKTQVVADGQNPPGPLHWHRGECPRSPTFQKRQSQRQACPLKETATFDGGWFSFNHGLPQN